MKKKTKPFSMSSVQIGITPRTVILKNAKPLKSRLVIGIPTTGIVRYEWATARWGQCIPVNWSMAEIASAYSQIGPIGYLVADARNIICHIFLKTRDCEWLFFIDHDVILPLDTFIKINEYIRKGNTPLMSGLYYAKGNPPSPLVFRGRGNYVYEGWKRGDKIEVDAVVMGCTLIHRSLVEGIANISENYQPTAAGEPIKKIFETPADIHYDPERLEYLKNTGTEDIYFCDRILENKILKKAGWKKLAKKKYPFLCDTSIFCRHIDVETGVQYP